MSLCENVFCTLSGQNFFPKLKKYISCNSWKSIRDSLISPLLDCLPGLFDSSSLTHFSSSAWRTGICDGYIQCVANIKSIVSLNLEGRSGGAKVPMNKIWKFTMIREKIWDWRVISLPSQDHNYLDVHWQEHLISITFLSQGWQF